MAVAPTPVHFWEGNGGVLHAARLTGVELLGRRQIRAGTELAVSRALLPLDTHRAFEAAIQRAQAADTTN